MSDGTNLINFPESAQRISKNFCDFFLPLPLRIAHIHQRKHPRERCVVVGCLATVGSLGDEAFEFLQIFILADCALGNHIQSLLPTCCKFGV